MTELQFTEEDIKKQLEVLGYHDVPRHRLVQFALDLEKLIDEDKIPLHSDESLYSDLSDHTEASHDRSQDTLRHRSPDVPADRAPLNDVHKHYRNNQTAFSARSKVKETSSDQENLPSPLPTATRNEWSAAQTEVRAGSTRIVDPKVYDPYQRRSGKPAGPADKTVAMKRKVMRKRDGQSQIFDESVTESESDVSYLNERLQDLPLNDAEVESDTSSVGFDSFRRHIGRPITSQGLYAHRPAGDEDSVFKPHLPRSFIRPASANPTWKHNKKTDPVTRHQMYRAQWSSQKAPGEKNHKGLRWSVREHMMYKDEVVQPRSTPRVYMPNDYVVPSDKKRQALRWAVRTQLARKEMPSTSFNYQTS